MYWIDVTITATLRPAIIRKSLRALRSFLLEPNDGVLAIRAIVNIDPVGSSKVEGKCRKVERMYRNVFDRAVVFRPSTPSFPLAVKRVWQTASAPIVFHCEDSKALVRSVPLRRILHAFEQDEALVAVALYPFDNEGFEHTEAVFDDKLQLWVAPFFHRAVGMLPSFFRTTYLRELCEFLEDGVSPEKAVRGSKKFLQESTANEILALNQRYKYGFLHRRDQAAAPYFVNVGRLWRMLHGFTKGKGGITTSWVKPKDSVSKRKYRQLVAEVVLGKRRADAIELADSFRQA